MIFMFAPVIIATRPSPDSSGIVDIPNGFNDFMEIDGNPAGPAREVCIFGPGGQCGKCMIYYFTAFLLRLL